MLLLATYTAIQVPMWLVLNFHIGPVLAVINIFVSFFFFLDMLVNIYEHRERAKNSKDNRGLKKYFKSQFITDFLSVIPFDLLVIYTSLPRELDFLAFVRVLRITQLSTLKGFARRWGGGEFSNPSVVRIFYFLYWIFLIMHWFACGWIKIHGRDVVDEAAKLFTDNPTTYIKALYWSVTTLTTIGYGDITPKTNNEIIYVIGVELFGAAMYGYIIGNIANLISNVDLAKAQFIEKMDKINTFMKYRQLPEDLQSKVNLYYSYLWESKKGYDESSVLSDLPSSLKMKVALYINKEMLEKIPLFKNASEEFLQDLVMHLRPVVYTPEDFIFRKGEIGKSLYFIIQGSVQVLDEKTNTVFATLTQGNFFGEIALLTSAPRTATVKAVDYCDLYALDKDTFEAVLQRYPDFSEEIHRMADERLGKRNADK